MTNRKNLEDQFDIELKVGKDSATIKKIDDSYYFINPSFLYGGTPEFALDLNSGQLYTEVNDNEHLEKLKTEGIINEQNEEIMDQIFNDRDLKMNFSPKGNYAIIDQSMKDENNPYYVLDVENGSKIQVKEAKDIEIPEDVGE